MRHLRTVVLALAVVLCFSAASRPSHAQAALLMEEPYGFFGALNPTGHTAVYFRHICAATPVQLRRCEPGETGAVIARYASIAGYDWIAIPLVPYLYSVENASQVPERVDPATVKHLREKYHEAHLLGLGDDVRPGGLLHGGWTELVGVAYERRSYAFRFETTAAQDDALIAQMNAAENRTHFDLLFDNCSDFARVVLNHYFPKTFRRSLFPDAGMTTPKQIAFKLLRYTRKHPEEHLSVFEIPQVPGYRRLSRSNKSIAESLVTTVYAIPIAVLNPYLAGGLFVDYVVRGRYRLIPRDRTVIGPDRLQALTGFPQPGENPDSARIQASRAIAANIAPEAAVTPGLREIPAEHDANDAEF